MEADDDHGYRLLQVDRQSTGSQSRIDGTESI